MWERKRVADAVKTSHTIGRYRWEGPRDAKCIGCREAGGGAPRWRMRAVGSLAITHRIVLTAAGFNRENDEGMQQSLCGVCSVKMEQRRTTAADSSGAKEQMQGRRARRRQFGRGGVAAECCVNEGEGNSAVTVQYRRARGSAGGGGRD